MVLSKIIKWVQVLRRAVQRLGAPVDGCWDDHRCHFEQQYLGGSFDGRGHRGQRMERVQENFRQSGRRFAYTTYAKALIEFRTYGRGIPFDGLEGFLIKMQTLDDTIVDFTPPLLKFCVQEYRTQFVYQPIHACCYGDGRHRPLLSAEYWSERDKKALGALSPTISLSESWVDPEHEEKEKDDNGVERCLGL